MSTWSKLAELTLVVNDYELAGLEQPMGEHTRKTTIISLHGGEETGVGEDVTYEPDDHDALQAAGPVAPLAGSWTVGSFAAHLRTLDLFPVAPKDDVYRLYRYWAFDSAALDLALRQNALALHEALGIEPQPLTFVASLRLGDPPDLAGIHRRLEIDPSMRFKLDPTATWDDEFVDRLSELAKVATVDLKGFYSGTVVDNPPDAQLYTRVARAFPQAWIEDPALDAETSPALEPFHDRITWDAPIHSVADIEALAFAPKTINIKPSRLGGLKSLCDVYDYCNAHAITMYGGGQTELGVGRGQIQYMASLFHPDTPNDTAPAGYNKALLDDLLPTSPLPPAPSKVGFRWGDS